MVGKFFQTFFRFIVKLAQNPKVQKAFWELILFIVKTAREQKNNSTSNSKN